MSENQTIFSFNGPSKLWNKLPPLNCHECTIQYYSIGYSRQRPPQKKTTKKKTNKQKQQKTNKTKRIKVDCSTIKVLSTERRP